MCLYWNLHLRSISRKFYVRWESPWFIALYESLTLNNLFLHLSCLRLSKHSAGVAGNIWLVREYKRASLVFFRKHAMVSLLKIFRESEILQEFTSAIQTWEDTPLSNWESATEFTLLWVKTTKDVLRNKLMYREKLNFQSRRYFSFVVLTKHTIITVQNI